MWNINIRGTVAGSSPYSSVSSPMNIPGPNSKWQEDELARGMRNLRIRSEYYSTILGKESRTAGLWARKISSTVFKSLRSAPGIFPPFSSAHFPSHYMRAGWKERTGPVGERSLPSPHPPPPPLRHFSGAVVHYSGQGKKLGREKRAGR